MTRFGFFTGGGWQVGFAAWLLSGIVSADDATFERDVLPIFRQHCQQCHGGEQPKKGLDLSSYRRLVVKGGSLKDSLLWTYLATDRMPAEGEPLSDHDKRTIQSWLLAGAHETRAFAVGGQPAEKTTASEPAGPRVPRGVLELVRVIDGEVDRRLRETQLSAAPRCDDAEFLRRVYLDIAGRIPTVQQVAAFLDSQEPDRRSRLIDELLASPHYGAQFGRVWRDWIAPAELPSEGNGGNQPMQATQNLGQWFGERFNQGDGWDRIVREVLTADGTLKEQPQGLFFSLDGDDQGRPQPGGTARAIGSLFLGVQLQCAQCHNDPFKEWMQADFWATAAFFRNLSWRFNGRYFDSVTEAFEVDVKNGKKDDKKTGFIKDAAPVGQITIPKDAFKNAGKMIPAKFVAGEPFAAEEQQPLRPVFTDWLTAPDNPFFARAFVNRTWAYFCGRGIVHPVDDFRAADTNLPSHPETLDALTREFTAAGFDVRHLVRCITNSQTYQRTSRPSPVVADQPAKKLKGKGNAKENERTGHADLVAAFGRMPVKVMSADMPYD